MTSHNDPVFFAIPQLPRVSGLEKVLASLPEARLVGGAVRDGLLGAPVADIDLAAPLPPEAILARLAQAGIRAEPTGLSHGTVTAISDGNPFEITTLRRDEETDGRHAIVAWTDDWREDAARRDFTINALYQSADGRIWDYFDGLNDLRNGRIRFVGVARDRIREDYLRILRFFRFQARYGKAQPTPDTLDAITQNASGLARLSIERVWHEWRRLLGGPNLPDVLGMMRVTGVLAQIMPEGADTDALARLIEKGAPADPLLRLAALCAHAPRIVAKRLKLSNKDADYLAALSEGPDLQKTVGDHDLRRLRADYPLSVLEGRVWLSDLGADEANTLRRRLEQTPVADFPLQGADILALGVPPGPLIGALLRRARSWWRDGGCTADAATCRAELAKMLKD